ncbi:hypothetical protein MNBD_UNCLBAC01-97 [hydrothermal vent metagenome]|uniref:Uncharacterized protein n=1 Tax=hydrothermal vent metagenome TaxID=652676 RepID=A0A3B1DD74_9ZZZZ
MNSTKKNKFKKNSWLLLLIIGINLIVYFPALKHLPRSDQFIFLIETIEKEGLRELIEHTYSYARTRHFGKGDEKLFKPIYFVILSFEKWLYGFKFFYWQLTSLCLHILVVWQLYKILMFIHPNRLAGLLAVSFSVLHISQEMVVYDHMAPYLIFMVLLLKAVQYLGRFIQQGQMDKALFFKMLAYLSIACFIHEYAMVCIVIIATALCIDRIFFLKKKNYQNCVNIFWLFVPIIVYVLWSVTDYLSKVGAFSLELSNHQTSIPIIITIFKFFILSIVTPIIPAFLDMKFNARISTKAFNLENIMGNFNPQNFWSNLNMLLVIIFVFWLFFFLKKIIQKFFQEKGSLHIELENNFHKGQICVGIISFFFSFAYICMMTFGRFMELGIEYLQINLYYFYTIILFNIIFFYCFYCWVEGDKKKKNFNKQFVVVIFSLLIVLNGFYIYRLNVKMMRAVSGLNEMLKAEISPKKYYLSHKYVTSGVMEMGRNDYDSAFSYFDQALKVNSKSHEAHMMKGIAFVDRKKYEHAIIEFKKSLMINSMYPEIYYNLGIAYMEQKKFNLAVKNFSKTIQLNPDFKNAYLNRANIYCLYGQYARAIEDYTKVIEIAPKDPRGYYNRAMTYQDMGKMQYALKDASKAKSLGFAEAEVYFEELKKLVDDL